MAVLIDISNDLPAGRPNTKDYRRLFLENTPLFDVRAPIEFQKGSIPGAVNLPLMTDDERKAVGISYKRDGQEGAIEVGKALVQGAVKQARIEAWLEFAAVNPAGYLFCLRGGLRSQISQLWMAEAGSPFPLVSGGYKALRRFLIDETERLIEKKDFIVVAGRTGVGKTDFIGAVDNAIDLEGLANHRGSSFGRRIGDQPTQINFENTLAVGLMKSDDRHKGPIFVEDESRRIGSVELPMSLAAEMQDAPVVLIEEPLQERVEMIHRDYVAGMRVEYEKAYGEDADAQHAAFMLAALHRIRKRLGGGRYQELEALVQEALQVQSKTGSDAAHRIWIERLLTDYYDPMYEYQLANHSRDILFTGSRAEAVAWARSTS